MEILKRPIVTEKVSAQNERGTYGFIVDKQANKLQIREAIEGLYGVTVEKVRTMNYAGKAKSRYTKSRVVTGRKASYKKAIVQVAEGEVIDFYSNI